MLNGLYYFSFLLVGSLAPGWLLGRALRVPVGLLGAFLGSAALLLNTVLVLDAIGVRLDATHLALSMGVICGLLALLARLPAVTTPEPARSTAPAARWTTTEKWLLVPVALGLAAIIVKASLDPLSGLDTKFRWDFLAQQMVREGNLHFYPPVAAEDFLYYGWCDGIAPLISTLYFWAYLSADKIVAWATTPLVIGQGALLFYAVYRLASTGAGSAAGCSAMAILATSAGLLSGIAIGQETGMTALALIAMFLFLERHQQTRHIGWLTWAGIAAGTGALAREYGLVFTALGALVLAQKRVSRHGWVAFFGAAFTVAAPWYVRNWVKTGNPLFSHSFGGLFPTNPVHIEYLRAVGELLSPWQTPDALAQLIQMTLVLAAVPLAFGFAGSIADWRSRWPWVVGFVVIIALWLWSVAQTSGGYSYSIRVLTPAIALAAVLGGRLVARWTETRQRWLIILVLTGSAIDAAQRSMFVPFEPTVQWWSRDFTGWRYFRREAEAWEGNPNWAAMVESAEWRSILTVDPYIFSHLLRLGGKPTTLFSPAMRFLFDPNADYVQCVARLRAEGARFIFFAHGNHVNELQLGRHPFFQALKQQKPSAILPMGIVYDLFSADLARTAPEATSTMTLR